MAAVTVRGVDAGDAGRVCDLWRRFRFGPAEAGVPFDAADFEAWRRSSGVVQFFVAEREGLIVGTLACSTVCEQVAARDGGVFATSLFVHPQFRRGATVAQLMNAAMQFCLQQGYRRLDSLVRSSNETALRLYKRAGGRRTAGAYCGDGLVELANYLPVVLPYIGDAAAGSPAMRQSAPPADLQGGFMQRLPSVARSGTGVDSVPWHGSEAVSYEVRLEREQALRFTVDVAQEAVAGVSGPCGELACYPAGSRVVGVGELVTVVVTCTNTEDEPRDVAVTTDAVPVAAATVAPGATWEALVVAGIADAEGVHRTNVEVTVSAPGGPPLWRLPLATWVRAVAVTPPRPQWRRPSPPVHIDAGSWGWRLENRWLSATVAADTGLLELRDRARGAVAVRELWPELGPPYPGAVRRPPPRPITFVALEEGDGEAALTLAARANAWHDDGLVVLRTIRLRGDPVVEVATSVARADGDPVAAPAGARLRTFPWVEGSGLDVVLPVHRGVFRAPVAYPMFPVGRPGFEAVPSVDLPTDPDALDAPWAAWCGNDGRVAGVVFPGAAALHFGLRWMPSVLYDLGAAARADDGSLRLPAYHLWCGPGGPEAVGALASDTAQTAGQAGTATAEPASRQRPGRHPGGGVWSGRTEVPVVLRLDAPSAGPPAARGRLHVLGRGPRAGELVLSDPATGASRAQPLTVPPAGAPFEVPAGPLAPGVHLLTLEWLERHGSCAWPVPIVVPAPAATRHANPVIGPQPVVDNGVLRLTMTEGGIGGLEAGGRRWLRGGAWPSGFRLAADGGGWSPGAPLDAAHVGDLRAVEMTDSTGLRWCGLQRQGVYEHLEVEESFLTAEGSPVVLARARYRNTDSQPRRCDSVFVLEAAAGGGQSFLSGGGDRPREYTVAGEDRPYASAAEAGGLRWDDDVLVLGSAGAQVCGWHDQVWRLAALDHAVLPAGGSRLVLVCLVITRTGVPLAPVGGLSRAGRSLHTLSESVLAHARGPHQPVTASQNVEVASP